MSEIRSIDVNINLNETSSPGPKPPTPNPTPVPPSPNVRPQDKSNVNKLTSVLLNQAYQKAKSLITQEVSYEVNKHFNLHDDYVGQRTLNVAKSIISKGMSIGMTTLAGFSLGGVPGAAIGLIGSIASTGVQVYQNYDQQNIKIRQMNAQLSFTRERAGYSLTSGSIGENL